MMLVPSKKEFAALMATLGTVFNRGEISSQMIDIYHSCLCDIPVDRLTYAVQKVLRTRKLSSMPTPAEIREMALDITPDDLMHGGAEAWSQANRALLSGIGRNDPILDQTIHMAFGGWERFGDLDPTDEPSDRKHFLKCYQEVRKRQMEAKYLTSSVAPKKLSP